MRYYSGKTITVVWKLPQKCNGAFSNCQKVVERKKINDELILVTKKKVKPCCEMKKKDLFKKPSGAYEKSSYLS